VTITRRDFAKLGFAGASLAFFSTRLGAAALSAFGQEHTLVVVQLIGGNDTLNTFIPYTDLRLRAARSTIGIPEAKVLKVDSRLGLHPSMTELAELYVAGKFAFVTNVGIPTPDRSHFYCQDVWQTANETPAIGEPGWIGRWADIYAPSSSSPAAVVGVTVSTPRGLVAKRVLPTCLTDVASFKANADPIDPSEADLLVRSLRRLYGLKKSSAILETIREQGSGAFEAVDLFHGLPPVSAVIDYPASPLGLALQFAAQLIAGHHGTNVIWVTLGGFDTHSNEVTAKSSTEGAHASLLRDLSQSLDAFQDDIELRGLADGVLVMAWSEFGRRVQENSSLGTDHGKAGSVMLLGKGVKGGQWYGDPYDLSDLDEGDLKPRIDFRAVYATIIEGWLGGDPALVLQKQYDQLGFLVERRPRQRVVRR
jgi:uncharacterized protein (DUF1501 family)